MSSENIPANDLTASGCFSRLLAAVARSNIGRVGGAPNYLHWNIAQKAWTRALAEEVLPAILGGRWFLSRTSLNQLFSFARYPSQLIDHCLSFRERGPRGRATWVNTILASQPYPYPQGSRLWVEGLVDPRRAADEHGVGVWVADQSSSWYTGRTTLVLIGRGLIPENALRFGFAAVAPNLELEVEYGA